MFLYPMAENMTGIGDLMEYVNSPELTGGAFAIFTLVTIYVGLFLFMLNRNHAPMESMASSGFITALAAVFFKLGGFISNQNFYIAIVAAVIPVAIIYFAESR